ncbi:MAG: hypothetical protein FNT15_09740 [Sulfurovum sp.]|nr:MAG: hypothetical protein FNT15_09740 [Sulfurovum sp.]
MNDIQNRADYSADGFGISASVSNSNHGVKDAPKELGTSKTIGYGSDRDHQATTTKSGIITSDKESEYAGKLANNFDKNEVQNEIDTSVRVTQSFDATRQSVKQEINKEIDEANKVLSDPKVSQSDKDKANENIEEMQEVGLLVDMVNGALYNPSDTLAGTAVNTLSPALVYKVGQYFKEEETEGSPQHILAQALVAGVTAGLAGNDILSSTISGGGGEAIAPYLAEYIYGVNPKDVSKMTAEQKQTISAIISLGSTAIGATSGSVTDMVASGEAGTVAVEENKLSEEEKLRRAKRNCDNGDKMSCIDEYIIIQRSKDAKKCGYNLSCLNEVASKWAKIGKEAKKPQFLNLSQKVIDEYNNKIVKSKENEKKLAEEIGYESKLFEYAGAVFNSKDISQIAPPLDKLSTGIELVNSDAYEIGKKVTGMAVGAGVGVVAGSTETLFDSPLTGFATGALLGAVAEPKAEEAYDYVMENWFDIKHPSQHEEEK